MVLGIDGMDPGFLERHWDSLPNLAKLKALGDFRRLGTTTPPQSPVAWSTVMTGLDPNGHGIFDFVRRDPASMRPVSSMGETVETGLRVPLGPYELPLAAAKVVTFRKGEVFWATLARHGVPATVLRMPANYPPARCRCQQLSGMGTPDLRGTHGTFTFYTDDAGETARDVPGGRVVRVAVNGGQGVLPLEGPANPLRKDRRPASVSIVAHVDRAAGAARFDVADRRIILRAGEWSGWLRLSFPLAPGVGAGGMARIFLKSVEPRLRVYVSPVNIDPAAPEATISEPKSYSRDLAKAVGPFYTQGIAEDTAALRAGVFDLREYLAQSRMVAEEQFALLHHALADFRDGLFFMHFLGVDQDSHVLWGRHEDLLLDTYRRFDTMVGRVMAKLPDAHLIVMSDHGFAPFDRAMHLNTWLLREGFLTLDDPTSTGSDELFRHVDWGRTQAYALGLNGLYLNLRGRERNGIVEPGAGAELLLRVITRRLLAFRDPVSGGTVISAVDAAGGTFAPDLIVGYAPGYRSSWESALGAVPNETITDNRDAWIGDHCIAARHVPGVLLSNRPVREASPELTGLAPAILGEFGVPRPPEMRGSPVF